MTTHAKHAAHSAQSTYLIEHRRLALAPKKAALPGWRRGRLRLCAARLFLFCLFWRLRHAAASNQLPCAYKALDGCLPRSSAILPSAYSAALLQAARRSLPAAAGS